MSRIQHPTVQPWPPVDLYEHFCAHREDVQWEKLFHFFWRWLYYFIRR